MRTSLHKMCCNMCGMCRMPDVHIYMISECDVFMMSTKK